MLLKGLAYCRCILTCTLVWDWPLTGWVLIVGPVVVLGRIFIYARPAFISQHWAVTAIVPNVHIILSPEPWDHWSFIYLGGGGFGSSSSAFFPFPFSSSALLLLFFGLTLTDWLGVLFLFFISAVSQLSSSLFLVLLRSVQFALYTSPVVRPYDYLFLLLLPSLSDVSLLYRTAYVQYVPEYAGDSAVAKVAC